MAKIEEATLLTKAVQEAQLGTISAAESNAENGKTGTPGSQSDESRNENPTKATNDTVFTLELSMHFKGVSPETVPTVENIIVRKAVAHNAESAAEGKGGENAGLGEPPGPSHDTDNVGSTGNATENQGLIAAEEAVDESSEGKEETAPTTAPELPPHRQYRTPGDPTDHGAAMREQLLRGPPRDPWASF